MNLRTSVHNDSRTLKEIKRRNEILVERLCKVKPVISSQNRPERYNHITQNSKKKLANYRQAEAVRKQNLGLQNRIQNIKMGHASFNHINPLYVVKEREISSGSRICSQDTKQRIGGAAIIANENSVTVTNNEENNEDSKSQQTLPTQQKDETAQSVAQQNVAAQNQLVRHSSQDSATSRKSPTQKFGSERSMSNSRLRRWPNSVHRSGKGDYKSHWHNMRENEMRKIHQANRKFMMRLMNQKSLIQPVEKFIEDDIKRQKILRMRMQLKNTPIGNFEHRRRISDNVSRKAVSPLENIFKTDLTSLQTLHTELVSQGGAATVRHSPNKENRRGGRKPDMLFLNPADKSGRQQRDIAPQCAIQQSRSQLNLNNNIHQKAKNDYLFSSVMSSRTNLTNDPYQLQNTVTGAPVNKSAHSQLDQLSPRSKSPSPKAALQRSQTVLDPQQSRLSEENRTVFFRHYGPHPKTGNMQSFKFSYDESAYYFKWTRAGEDASHTLILPVCRQTIELIEQYQGDMHSLAARLKLDKKTGKLYIQDFKPPVVDIEETSERILPMLTKLLTQEVAACANQQLQQQPRRNIDRVGPPTSMSQQIIKTHYDNFNGAEQSRQERVGVDPPHLKQKSENQTMIDIRLKLKQQSPKAIPVVSTTSQSNIPSVFKSFASAKKSRRKEGSQFSARQNQNNFNSYKQIQNSEKERQAYFQSKKMRAAPQITPLAPLTTTNKMCLSSRLRDKKQQKQLKMMRYKEKSEEILSDPMAFNPIENNIACSPIRMPTIPGSLITSQKRLRHRKQSNLSFQGSQKPSGNALNQDVFNYDTVDHQYYANGTASAPANAADKRIDEIRQKFQKKDENAPILAESGFQQQQPLNNSGYGEYMVKSETIVE